MPDRLMQLNAEASTHSRRRRGSFLRTLVMQHHSVVFHFQDAEEQKVHLEQLTTLLKRQIRKKQERAGWRGRVLMDNKGAAYVYNLFTEQKELSFNDDLCDEGVDGTEYSSNAWQLKDGSFIYEPCNSTTLFEYDDEGLLQNQFDKPKLSNTAHVELANGNLLVSYGTLYEYLRNSGKTIIHNQADITKILELHDGRILLANHKNQILFCDESLHTLRVIDGQVFFKSWIESKPGTIICYGTHLYSISVDKWEPTQLYANRSYKVPMGVVVLDSGNIVFACQDCLRIVRDERLVHSATVSISDVDIVQLSLNRIGCADKTQLCILNAITGWVEKTYVFPTEGVFLSIVQD